MPKHQRTLSTRNARSQSPYSKDRETPGMKAKDISPAVSVVGELEKLLKKAGSPGNALGMEKYMRNQFNFIGVKTPQRKETMKQVTCNQLSKLPICHLFQ